MKFLYQIQHEFQEFQTAMIPATTLYLVLVTTSGMSGSVCPRPASSCGAGAWVWAVAISDATPPVCTLIHIKIR